MGRSGHRCKRCAQDPLTHRQGHQLLRSGQAISKARSSASKAEQGSHQQEGAGWSAGSSVGLKLPIYIKGIFEPHSDHLRLPELIAPGLLQLVVVDACRQRVNHQPVAPLITVGAAGLAAP